MARPDLNLLITLDTVLSEGSVARAARKMGLSPSAMSRALARLRQTTGDPLLVKAGRGLVATPRALALRDEVSQLVRQAEAVLSPAGFDLKRLERTFTLRTREGFPENFGLELIARTAKEAPGVRLCFVQKPDKESALLREEGIDLETGVVTEATDPALRTQSLFRDRYVGVVRKRHPLARDKVTAERYAAGRHILISPRGLYQGPIDDALREKGLTRRIVATVGGFSAALALVRDSDLIVSVPERHTGKLRTGLHSFALPVPMPGITISMLWHPRLDADPAHRWLRGLVRQVCTGPSG